MVKGRLREQAADRLQLIENQIFLLSSLHTLPLLTDSISHKHLLQN